MLGFVGILVAKAAWPKSQQTTLPSAGVNSPIDGIPCNINEQLTYHEHARLYIYINGKRSYVPAYVGIPDPQGTCLYWLHVHPSYPNGIIHMEFPKAPKPPATLGQFFAVWNGTRPVWEHVPTVVMTDSNLRIYIDKDATKKHNKYVIYHGSVNSVVLRPHELIAIESGKHVKPPKFSFASIGL